MKNTNETDALKEKIYLLKNRQTQEFITVKEQFNLAYESVKPINFIKNTLEEVSSSPDIKDNILNNVIGLTTGYLSKKVLMGNSHNPIKRVLGVFLQYAVANVVAKHSETIKSTGTILWNRIVESRDKKRQHNENNRLIN